MIADHRTWRQITCVETVGTPGEKACLTFRCSAFRLWKAPKGTVFNDNNINDFKFYCGVGGVPTCDAELNIP